MHEVEGAHGKVDFASEKAAAPDDLKFVLDGQCASIDPIDTALCLSLSATEGDCM